MSPRAMSPLVLAALEALALGGCTAPDYGNGHLQCAPSGACPSGFYCAGDDHCWRDGSGPPAAGDLGGSGGAGGGDLAAALLDLASGDLAVGPSKCGAGSGVILCEGFENPLILGNWSLNGKNGTPSRDTTRAFRGKASLRSHIDAAAAMSSPHATASEMSTFPIAPTLYARVWVYFPSPLPPSFEQLLNFTDAGTTGFAVATDSGAVALDDYAGTIYQKSMTQMPLDRWACVQFEVAQGTPSGTMRIYVDGQLLGDLPQTGTTTTAVSLFLGLDFYGNGAAVGPYDAWFDELILDNKPTTCDE